MPSTTHDTPLTLLGGRSTREFLRDYWQKRPLLVRQALPGFRSPLSPEELAGLACEEHVEARLVLERDGAYPWQVRHGPFSADDFISLPTSHWSLLVQEVNRLLPEADALMQRFRFIPDWRMDDVMVSFAPVDGSVGPHLDQYDVFLIQAQGRRHWSISGPMSDPELVQGTDLRILADFKPGESWTLEPGDLLYLPPGVPHHGVALEDAQTWSVGFRAPSHRDLVAALAEYLLEGIDPEARFVDPDLAPQAEPAEIAGPALDRVRHILEDVQRTADPAAWLGRLVTENRSGLGPEPPDDPYGPREIVHHLTRRRPLRRTPGVRFAFTRSDGVPAWLFVEGQAWQLEAEWSNPILALCGSPEVPPDRIRDARGQPGLLDLLCQLYNEGYIY